ncbi:hypothetical protein CC2G_013328 [Coprinopsis cinerea AmutBmut pab1-1]|nr:hypothetical protein CC2G_013328 [Coprinopsis cinerea AmutBmut pab1-1]
MPHPSVTRGKVWFRDGNVVLQIENVQFRVHIGVIERHSIVLKEKLANLSASGEDTGPVVCLDDSAKDWEELLLYIYDGAVNRKADENLLFPIIAAMLRLGHKYKITALRDEGLARIKRAFPSSLELFCKTDGRTRNCFYLPYDGQFADVMKVMVELGLKKCLPAMYYAAVCDYPTYLTILDQNADLPLAIVQTLALGHARVYQGMMTHVFSHLIQGVPVQGCERRGASGSNTPELNAICKARCSALLENLVGPPLRLDRVLYPWDHETWYHTNLCGACARFCVSAFTAGRLRFWEALPSYFGLPAWNELKDFVRE